jgi:hypothetical protein
LVEIGLLLLLVLFLLFGPLKLLISNAIVIHFLKRRHIEFRQKPFLYYVYMSSVYFSFWSLSGQLDGNEEGRRHFLFSYGFSQLIVQPI